LEKSSEHPLLFYSHGNSPGTPCITDWIDLRANLIAMVKRKVSYLYRELNHNSTVFQLIA
jgi:hypothetical protein